MGDVGGGVVGAVEAGNTDVVVVVVVVEDIGWRLFDKGGEEEERR